MKEVEEELSKVKQKVDWSLYEYHYDHDYSDYSFLHDYTKEFLEKSQNHFLEIKEMLKDNEKIISEQNIQLEEKEEEIEKLKDEISQVKEEKKEDDELSRILADLKELRESNVNLKTQLEETKRREEVVRNQLNKREESCHKMEAEVVNLRKKVEKSNTQVKFLNKSMILDEILDSQRSPNDKSGLGYNKEEISNPKKPDASPSFVKGEDRSDASLSFIKMESRYDAGPSCSKNERNTTIFKRSDQGRHLEATHTPQSKFRRETPSWMNQRKYESVFNGYCFSCNEYGHKALDCRHHGRKQIGRFNNNIRCWNCNLVGHIATHCYTMRCYSCGGYGHKSHDCWNSKRQSIRNASHNMTRRVNKTWKRKSEVPNKKDDEYISPEIDEVHNRSLVGETSNKEYSLDKDKEASGAHNSDVDDESPTKNIKKN
jgi:hypothetical protein